MHWLFRHEDGAFDVYKWYGKISWDDGSSAERCAIKASFPETVLLLCTFNVLLATWRWLRNDLFRPVKCRAAFVDQLASGMEATDASISRGISGICHCVV